MTKMKGLIKIKKFIKDQTLNIDRRKELEKLRLSSSAKLAVLRVLEAKLIEKEQVKQNFKLCMHWSSLEYSL